ncbi:hypothetical protein [Catenuloplanes atrovinosus]|uniref:Uncharacterized protein n=1 Tax=Catenuloplanes atrovinosus TaxID=137266 RepID=A0AAE3YVM9_9ACTN|nr:hypothetical protein [Catenuloplanes atrovinosus]MDR7278856.1 hypothetical protein [Catenuloplanes atrovinosus]
MRFFQSESHPKPDDTTDDNDHGTDTVRSEPVPVPRGSEENDVADGGTHRSPDTDLDGRPGDGTDATAADRPHISTGFTDSDPTDTSDLSDTTRRDDPGADDSTAADRPHFSIGAVDQDPAGPDSTDLDRDGDDSSVRTGEPVDAEVVPAGTTDDEPVFVEPVPQETAFGAATVGGAVAASELAARREIDDPDAPAVATAPVPQTGAERTDAFGTPVAAESPSEFGREGDLAEESPWDSHRTGDGPAGTDEAAEDEAAQSPHDFGRVGDTDDEAAQSPHEFGRAGDATGTHDATDTDGADADRAEDSGTAADRDPGHVEGFGTADRTDDEGFGTADRTDEDEGFGAADRTDGDKGFGAADRTDGDENDKPLRAESVGEPAHIEGFGAAGATTTTDETAASERLAEEDRPGDEADTSGSGHTAALGAAAAGAVAGVAAAGAVGAARAARSADSDDHDTPTGTTDRDRDGDGRVNGEPATPVTGAAVPIEPIPAPADAETRDATTVDEPVELLPGDVPEQPALAAFFSESAASDFRDRWREVQLRFVDDPAQAAADAGTLVDEVVAALNAAIAEQREALGGAHAGGQSDTEQLRVLVRRQRDFLDRILGL